MSRTRNIATQILDEHEALFTTDFEKNKEALLQVAVVKSKQLRNELAGYITAYMKAKKNAETPPSEEEESKTVA